MAQDRYKINLQLWREKQYATASESSSVEFLSQQKQNEIQQPQQKSTQELFEDYCRKNRKQLQEKHKEFERELQKRNEQEALANQEDEEVASINTTASQRILNENTIVIPGTPPPNQLCAQSRENSDEGILMSPLLVESESDTEDLPEICNDAVEQIDVDDFSVDNVEQDSQVKKKDNESNKNDRTKEDKQNKKANFKPIKQVTSRKARELARLEEDIVDSLKIGGSAKLSQRQTRQSSENPIRSTKRQSQKLQATTSRSNSKEKLKSNKENVESKDINVQKTTNQIKKRDLPLKKTAATPIKTKEDQNLKPYVQNEKSTKKTVPNQSELNKILLNIKKEPMENSEDLESYKRYVKAVTEKRQRRKTDIPAGVHVLETRSMQRLTRSAEKSKRCKYRSKNLALQIDKIKNKKKKLTETPKKIIKKEESQLSTQKQNKINNQNKKESALRNTQASILSHTQSDFEPLQCAQRLSGDAGIFNASNNSTNKPAEFLVPPTPLRYSNNSLIPASMTSSFLNDSEIVFVPTANASTKKAGAAQHVVSLTSSDTETSQSLSNSSTSRRTRALKPRKTNQQQNSNLLESDKLPSFSELLAKQNARSKTKSPDLFSNCSDLGQITCSQVPLSAEQEPNTPFEGFKIFGSEVKYSKESVKFQYFCDEKEKLQKSVRLYKKLNRLT